MFKPTPSLVACAISASLLAMSTAVADDNIDTAVEDIALDMEVIVISGSRTEKALKDVAGSISVITHEDIEKQAISDMNQLFKYDPSIQITGKVGGAQNFLVRGMGSDRVLMIKDGMRMNEGYGANGLNDIVGRGFIETDTLKQVEVAKGAASSLYGSDALGGIIVFTTKDASDYLSEGETFASKVKLGYADNNQQANIGTTLALKTGNFEHLLNLSYRDGEEEQNYQESDAPFAIDSSSLLYKGKYKLNNTDYFSFTADIWQQQAKGDSADGLLYYFRGLAPYGYNIAKENSTNNKDTESFKLGYHSETPSAFYDLLNINLYKNKSTQEDEEYGLLDINAPMFGVVEMRDMWKTSDYEQDTIGLLSNASIKINNQHTLGYGLDIETTESTRTVHEYREVAGETTKDVTTNKFPQTDTFRAGIFINDEIKMLDGRLTLTPGIRFDRYEMDPNGALKADGVSEFAKIDENHTSLNFAALYKLSDDVAVFAQYGQGFKVPAYDLAYIEHYNQATSTYIYEIIPSDDLKAEESDSYEIGLRGQINDFAFNSAIYYNKYDNFLAIQVVSSEQVLNEDGSFSHQHDKFQYQNINSVTIKGIEAAVSYYLNDNISLFANASLQDGKDDGTDEYIDSISPLSGAAGISYEAQNWSTEMVMNWAKRMTKVNEGKAEVAGYGVIDWITQYELNSDLKINLVVNNLFDKEYVRYVNVAGHAVDSSFENIAEAGRNFSATVSYNF